MSGVPEEAFIESTGGKIFVRAWRPAAPRAVVVICHGVNSHGGQYLWAAGTISDRNLAVYTLDLRGRGRSDGARFHVDNVLDYAEDVHRTVLHAKSQNPGLPVFLLGHSAGGVTSCIYTLEHQAGLKGLICESFAFRVPAPELALAIIKGVSHLLPDAPVLKLHNKDFSRDPAAVAALDADPLIHNEVQPAETVAALVRADERLEKEFPKITLPVFILHGTADKATLHKGSEFFYETAGSEDKTLKLYDGHFHDLLNDYGKEEVLAEMIAWIEARI